MLNAVEILLMKSKFARAASPKEVVASGQGPTSESRMSQGVAYAGEAVSEEPPAAGFSGEGKGCQ